MSHSVVGQPLYEVKAGLFKGLAHPLRIRVLELLSASTELSVTDLLAEMRIEPSHLSQHLVVLRRYRLVESDRRGSHVFYRTAFPEVTGLLRAARELLSVITLESASHRQAWADLPPVGSNPTQP